MNNYSKWDKVETVNCIGDISGHVSRFSEQWKNLFQGFSRYKILTLNFQIIDCDLLYFWTYLLNHDCILTRNVVHPEPTE